MKFTKEQAFESLKGILTNNGKKTLRMSEKSVNKQLDTLIPLVSNDEMELADFVEKVKPTFETMNSNAEKDNSDFVKQWEKDHPTVTPPKDKEPNPKDDPNLQALNDALKRLEALEAENAESKKAKAISQKREELVAAMEKEGVKDKKWINSFLSEVSITEELDVDKKAKAYAKFYNKDNSRTPYNVVPGDTGGNRDKGDPFKDVTAHIKQRRETEANLNVN